jgi:hypothetical protein
MSRPTTHADLPDYARKGHVVATIPATYITRYPSLGQHLLAALAEAERLGLTIEDDDIVIQKTDDELDAALKSAQNSWDTSQRWYDEAANGEVIDSWKQYSVKSHAKAEGLLVPEFDDAGNAVFDVEAVAK